MVKQSVYCIVVIFGYGLSNVRDRGRSFLNLEKKISWKQLQAIDLASSRHANHRARDWREHMPKRADFVLN